MFLKRERERGKRLTNRSCVHSYPFIVYSYFLHMCVRFSYIQKLLPLDLRPKKTRAIRRALTTAQKKMVTVREMKRAQNFPRRKYAIKA